MEQILKSLSPSLLLLLLPSLLIRLGNYYKNKDKNSTGADDAFGNVLIAAAPAVQAAADGNENAVKKALKIVRDVIDNYLNAPNLQPFAVPEFEKNLNG